MIALLILYAYIAFTTIGCGLLFVAGFNHFTPEKAERSLLRPDIVSIAGFIILTAFFGFYSLFFRLGGWAPHALLLIFATSGFITGRKFLQIFFAGFTFSPGRDLLFATLFIMLLAYLLPHLVESPKMFDTALYHAQAIQWMEKYPVVSGLGNLHGRLAFNSSFFLLSAVYSGSFVGIQPFYPLNGYFAILVAARLIFEMRKNLATDGTRFFIFALLFFLLLAGRVFVFASSPHTDFLPLILVIYIFILTQDSEFKDETTAGFRYLMIALFCFFVVTVKLSTLPVLLLLVVFSFHRFNSRWRMYFPVILTGIVVLTPWLIRNYILSGYFVYPLPAIDVFNPDWKIPITDVIAEKTAIRGWAIQPGERFAEAAGMGIFQWFPAWYERMPGTFRILFLFTLATPLVATPVFLIVNKARRLMTFWIVCYTGFLFWFFSAPEIRFGYGFIFFAAVIPLAIILEKLNLVTGRNMLANATVAILLVYTLVSACFLNSGSVETFSRTLILPEPIVNKEVRIVEHRMMGFNVKIPAGDQRCFDCPIPCTNFIKQGLELRGNNLRDGFRISK
jgi:hypothetical protein